MSARSHSRNMLTTFVGNFYPAVIALVTGPILAHALGVFGRGQVAAGQAPLALISTVAAFGIPEAVTFAVASAPGLARLAARRAAWILSAAGLVGMVAVFFASTWLSGDDADTRVFILIASLAIIPTLLVGLLRGVAAATQHWERIAFERISAATMRLIVILVLWGMGALTPMAATIVLAVMPLVGALAYVGLPALVRGRYEPPETAETAGYRALTSYGGRVWLGAISGILLSRIDQVLMTGLSSAYALGLYVIAVTVSELPLMINSAVRDVTFATDAAKPADDRLTSSARVSFLVCGLAAIALGGTMWWWIPILFGEDFAEAIPVAAVLLVAVAIGTPGSVAGAGLSARGRPGLRSVGMAAASVTNLVLLVGLTPWMGAMGAAIATLVGNLVASNANIVFLRKHWGLRFAEFYLVRGDDVRVLRRFVTGFFRRRR